MESSNKGYYYTKTLRHFEIVERKIKRNRKTNWWIIALIVVCVISYVDFRIKDHLYKKTQTDIIMMLNLIDSELITRLKKCEDKQGWDNVTNKKIWNQKNIQHSVSSY